MRYSLIIMLFVITLASCMQETPSRQVQGEWDGWQFRQIGTSEFFPAAVPGCIHTDLLNNGLIEDPYFGTNESGLQWIGEEEWEYAVSIFPAADILQKSHIELEFEGLDTYAEVSLNGINILKTDNMFRKWHADVKGILKEGENRLSVKFLPPGAVNEKKSAQLPYKLPDNRAFTRKAPYQFGWDWGPVFETCGIWKPVTLQAWDDFRIKSLHVHYGSIDEDPLPVDVQLWIESGTESKAKVRIFDAQSNTSVTSERISLKEGTHMYNITALIENPALWWPAGLGEQKIYEWRVELLGKGIKDEMSTRFGIRDVELIREPDAAGETFYFSVNGLPVFMKGANYVPQDNFLPRVSNSRYEKLIASVKDANMNMLRVWGGGFYEKDIFYDLCDENGILVWQDFMFACNMYPGDEEFLKNVQQEAIDNVIRLSNHPSIALWCGNNEIDEGWHNWGWQDALGYSESDSAKIWHDYLKIFHEILPSVVAKYDPGTVYHPSSPMTGWGREEAYIKGDVHYWGVWWGEEPFAMYRKKIGRFVSEYGFQGMPPIETIESFGGVDVEDPSSGIQRPVSEILEAHQKHPRGTELIQKYMNREFIVPEDFDDYIYVSQVLQAEGMGQAFIAHRISQPYCMGTLYWQLNDCWPVTSWSGLDYYHRWKALHYHIRRAYASLMTGTIEIDKKLHVFAVNDHPKGINVTLNCRLAGFDGKIISSYSESIDLMPQSSSLVYMQENIPDDRYNKVFIAELMHGDSLISRTFQYFVPTREQKLEDPSLVCSVEKRDGNIIVSIEAEKLARQVFLEAPGLDGRFEDNFFDMEAGEHREVRYIGPAGLEKIKQNLKVRSIYDTYH